MPIWELAAREQIRDTLARYNWSGDAGRLDALASTFCEDGVLDIRGFDRLRGRAAIVAFLGGVTGAARATIASGDVKPVKGVSTRSLCGTTSPTCCSPP